MKAGKFADCCWNSDFFIFISFFVCPLLFCQNFNFFQQNRSTFDFKIIAVNTFFESLLPRNSEVASFEPHIWPRSCLWLLNDKRCRSDESQSARSCSHWESKHVDCSTEGSSNLYGALLVPVFHELGYNSFHSTLIAGAKCLRWGLNH